MDYDVSLEVQPPRKLMVKNHFGFVHGLLPAAPKYAPFEIRYSITEYHIENDFDFTKGNIFLFFG